MLKTKKFSSIFNLEIEENIEMNFLDLITLTNKNDFFEKIFNPEDLKIVFGLNETQSVYNNKLILYNEQTYETNYDDFNDREYLIRFLLLGEIFCQCLWLIKDNSVCFELAHLIYNINGEIKVHSNFWNSLYTDSKGSISTVEFDTKELEEVFSLLPIVFSIYSFTPENISRSVMVTSKLSRISRALYFLQSARNCQDIGTKIAHYCSVFESLFSVSNTELKHRLSETVSFFLETEGKKRLNVYKTLQAAYDIRSSIVHGDGIQSKFLKNNSELLFIIASETDEILRQSILKILSDEKLLDLFSNKTKDDINLFNQNLIFSS